MLTTFEIENYKKFKQIRFDGLKRINVFLGANNVGKTTILEALMIYACGFFWNPILGISVLHRNQNEAIPNMQFAESILNVFHKEHAQGELKFSVGGLAEAEEGVTETTFTHVFHPGYLMTALNPDIQMEDRRQNPQKVPITIPDNQGNPIVMQVQTQHVGSWDISSEGKTQTIPILLPQLASSPVGKPHDPAVFHDTGSLRRQQDEFRVYSGLMTSGRMEEFVKEINRAFPGIDIESIENIPYPDGSRAPLSLLQKNGNRLPLSSFGEGVCRWYDLFGRMVSYRNALHCIEEAEVSFNHQAQKVYAETLMRYAQDYNNQVFMTTHSKEFLQALLTEFGDTEQAFLAEQVRVMTLREGESGVLCRALTGQEALDALDRGLELRL